VDSYIFVGTNFRGFMKNDYFIGTWICRSALSKKDFNKYIIFRCDFKFVNIATHENWYPTK